MDYLDLNSLFEQGEDLYKHKNYPLAISYFKQARNTAIQFERIDAIKVDLTNFKKRCNCFIGKCYEKLEEKVNVKVCNNRK